MSLSADEIIARLGLFPLPVEGGYFAETWRGQPLTDHDGRERHHGSAIYYLVTPSGFSAMHRLPTDEVFHFYGGDPVEQLLLLPDGSGRMQVLGADLASGQRPQTVVPAGAWQGSRLVAGGARGYALTGTTMAPGYHPDDYEHGDREALASQYPQWRDLIVALTRDKRGDDA